MKYYQQPFEPAWGQTQTLSVVAATDQEVTLADSPQVEIVNLGESDLLVNTNAACDEETSFHIAANTTRILTRSDRSAVLHVMRPTDADTADILVTPGQGY